MALTSPDNIRTPDSGDEYALTVDLGVMADTVQAAFSSRGSIRRGSPSLRTQTVSNFGDRWLDTDGSFRQWAADGNGGWRIANAYGRMARNNQPGSIGPNYTDLSGNARWSTFTSIGMAEYSNGWTIPVGGEYEVSYVIRLEGSGFLSGIVVNPGNSVNSDNFAVGQSVPAVQNVAQVTVSSVLTLAQGDKVTLWGITETGTRIWSLNLGYFSVRQVV